MIHESKIVAEFFTFYVNQVIVLAENVENSDQYKANILLKTRIIYRVCGDNYLSCLQLHICECCNFLNDLHYRLL